METVLITGSSGFVGRNLVEKLAPKKNLVIKEFDKADSIDTLLIGLKEADIVFHLAGVTRPGKKEEYEEVNYCLTSKVLQILNQYQRTPQIVFSSSIQAVLNNDYGISKKRAEDDLIEFSKRTGASVYIFRLPNIFGKWARPNYTSVVATFCHNISHGLDIQITNPSQKIRLVYIEDVINKFVEAIEQMPKGNVTIFYLEDKAVEITLKELANKIFEIRKIYNEKRVFNYGSDKFMKNLLTTYKSYANFV